LIYIIHPGLATFKSVLQTTVSSELEGFNEYRLYLRSILLADLSVMTCLAQLIEFFEAADDTIDSGGQKLVDRSSKFSIE